MEYQISSSIEIIENDTNEYDTKEIADVIPQEYLQSGRNERTYILSSSEEDEEYGEEKEEMVEVHFENILPDVVSIETQTQLAVENISTQVSH